MWKLYATLTQHSGGNDGVLLGVADVSQDIRPCRSVVWLRCFQHDTTGWGLDSSHKDGTNSSRTPEDGKINPSRLLPIIGIRSLVLPVAQILIRTITETMGPPTIWMRVRQTLGRALRETAQALDRVAMRARQHALTDRLIGDDPYRFDDHLSRHRHLFPLIERGKPVISDDVAYLAPCSTLIGSVRVEAGASIWYKAILRADQCENGSSFVNSDEVEMKEPFTLDPERVETSRFTNRDIGGAIYIGENSNVQDGCIVEELRSVTWHRFTLPL